MRAYSELYVEDAQENLAVMLDWMCNWQGFAISQAFSWFASSALGDRFGVGEPAVVAGKSGVELGCELLRLQGLALDGRSLGEARLDCVARSPEFWTGWILAYFQWSEGATFRQIGELVSAEDVRRLYRPYHEMDIEQGCMAIAGLMREGRRDTNLKRIRVNAGLSQADLSRLTGVSVRSIQHYEQRQKCINKASAETVLRLSECLCCSPRDLMEPISRERYEYALAGLK